MKYIDFSTITACGECCVGCKKKESGFCEGCIESDGHCMEWKESGVCKVHACAKRHGVTFCGLCEKFPCENLPKIISWNKNIIQHLQKLVDIYKEQTNKS